MEHRSYERSSDVVTDVAEEPVEFAVGRSSVPAPPQPTSDTLGIGDIVLEMREFDAALQRQLKETA